ncbi:MAG TPA: S41 family peptidase [Ktedonobacteraceae bacterium]|nr:S41 family peptidase [Ktedonobacteraceae bacterium]
MRYDDPRWYEQPEKKEQQILPPDGQLASSDEAEQPEDANQQRLMEEKEQRRRRILTQIVMTVAFMAIAFLGGWFSHQAYTSSYYSPGTQSQKYANLIQQAWSIIDQNYVDRKAINYQQMSYDAIRAMLNDLGDTGHTRFLTPQDVKAEQQQLSGTFAGVGIYIQQDPKTKDISITSTIPGAPAQKAGLKAGDIIIEVNGKNIVGMDQSAVQPLIQGPAGTPVSITVRRPSTGQILTFKIIRAQIQVPNVTMHYIPEDHIADIQIVQFSSGVSDELKTAILQAKKEGATKIILDLRNNPGGYLQEAIDTASEFMASGTVVIQQDSSGHQTKYTVTGQTVDTKIPMVVLVNENTASAAEIVTAALQDNGRAIVIGTPTYGTGTVLQEFDLSDGSAILLGVDEWLTPDGKFIRKTKIQPTKGYNIPMNLNNVLTPDMLTQNNMTLAQILKSNDVQLISAINYLQSH